MAYLANLVLYHHYVKTNASIKQTQNTNMQIIIGDIFTKQSIIFVKYSQEISQFKGRCEFYSLGM